MTGANEYERRRKRADPSVPESVYAALPSSSGARPQRNRVPIPEKPRFDAPWIVLTVGQTTITREAVMYRRILVPVDASPCSVKGLTEALQLAGVLHARVLLLHVVNELISEPALAPAEYQQHLIESMRAVGKETLENAHAIANGQGVDAEVKLIETIGGRASDCIVDAAKQWGAELIVMGTHGRRGMSRLAMGSDAELVVRSSPVPVLLVRSGVDL